MSEPHRPASRNTAWKIVASVVVVSAALAYLLYSSTKAEAQYYRHVDEVVADFSKFKDKRLQVHGFVQDGSIEQAKGTLDYRFKIISRAPERTPAVIEAYYTGLVPDTFKSGAEVVANGSLTADNRLSIEPDGIMAKCPSKYDAEKTKPGQGYGSGEALPGAKGKPSGAEMQPGAAYGKPSGG